MIRLSNAWWSVEDKVKNSKSEHWTHAYFLKCKKLKAVTVLSLLSGDKFYPNYQRFAA